MATPSFQSVSFVDPWGTVPPGAQTGVLVTISNSASAPAGSVAIARLLQSGAPIAYGTGGTPGFVSVMPPGPLTAALPYLVQAQWAPQGTNPSTASWVGTGVVTAPVITSGLAIISGSVGATTASFGWMPEGSAQPSYGFVQVFDSTGKAASILVAKGSSGSASFKYTSGGTYAAYASAAALISPSVPNVYTSGPLSPARAVPVAAPALTSVAYDGTTLTVGWTAPALPASPVVVDAAYAIVLYSGTTLVGSFPADAGGGTAVVNVGTLGASISVAGVVSYGVVRGPAGTGASGQATVIAGAPTISTLVATSSAITATIAAPASAAGISGYQGYLFEDGRQVAGPIAATSSGGTTTVAFTYAVNPQRRYSVRARGIGSSGSFSGPLGPAAVAVSSIPTVVSTIYDGASVTASWTPLQDPAVTGYVATLADAQGTTVGSPVTVQGTTAVISAPGLQASTAYHVTVQAVGGQATGPASASAPVVVETVAVTGAVYDGTNLSLTWATAQTQGAAYRVQVSANGAVVATQSSAQTSAPVPLSLAPGTSYSASVRVVSGGATGPVGAASGVIAASPSIGPVSATATTVTATVLPPASAPNASGYRGWLYQGGQPVAGPVNATTNGETTSLAFTYALQPQGAYAVRAQAVGSSAAFAGPVGPGTPAIGSVVSGISTSYDGTNVTVTWDAPADPLVTGYTATLAIAGGAVVGSPVTVDGTRAVLPAPSLSPDQTYQVTVQVLGGQATGPASSPGPVVAETVSLTSASYDGATLTLAWGAAETDGASYLVEVSSDGAVVAAQASGQAGASIPAVLSPDASYGAAVRVISGTASGPAGTSLGIVSAVPGVSAVAASASTVTATVAIPSPAPNVTGYQGWLYAGDAVVAGPVAATSSGGVTSVAFAYTVSSDKRYSVRVGATGAGAASGPQSAAGAVVSVAPAVAQTAYDGNTVTASWKPVLDPSVTAYVATLAEVGGAVVGSPVTVEGTSVSIPASGLSSAKTYQVTVQAASGSSTGPAGAAGSVVVETVAVTSSSYGGTLLALGWGAAQTGGATYLVRVLSGGSVVAEQASAQTSAAIPVALAAGGSYSASVQVVSGAARGPSGTASALVAAVPGVSSVAATASAVTVIVAVPAGAQNVSGYRGWLYEGGSSVAGPVTATTSAGVTSVAFTYSVQPQSRYTVVVQAVGSAASAYGPTGAPGAVVSSVPAVASTVYDGTNVTATWDAVADPLVTGYVATLTDSEGGVIGAPVTVEGTTAVLPAADLDPDGTYNVAVQAIGDAATGPASPAAAVLATALSITAASYDGALLSLAWAASSTPGATYRVQVSANGAAVATQAAAQPSATLPVVLGAAGSYTAAVQVVVGTSTGPLGPSAGLVTAVPGSGETTATATGVSAVVVPPAVTTNVGGYQGWLYEGGQQVAGPVSATSSGDVTTVAFTYTLHPSNPYAVHLQAIGSSAAIAGPVAPPAAVMASVPVVTSTSFDGTETTVTWDAVADATITGYRATLTDSDGGTIGSPADVQTTEAVLPGPTPAEGKTYSVSVQALGALSVGVASAAAPVIVETVALTSVAYDGASLSLAWAAATGGASYEVDIVANGAAVATQSSAQTSAAIPIVLNPATSYSAAVRVISGSARGNAGAATGIVAAAAGVSAVAATASAVTATVAVPSPAPNVTGYQGWLYAGDAVVAGPVAATTSGGTTSVAFTYAVAADQRYSVRIGATGAGAATGPQGAAGAVVSVAPAVAETGFDGSTVTASWAAVLDPSVTAYVATLAEVGGAVVGSPVTVEGTSVAIPASGLSSSKSYQVTVQALSGASSGPAGAAGSVVVETVALTSAAYDGASLSLAWAAAATGGASYEVDVVANGAAVATQSSAQTSAAIPIVLNPATSYSAAVRVISGSARGNVGVATGIVAAVAGVSAVAATASAVTATVAVPSPAPNVTGYQGWLYAGDAVVAGPVAATTSGGTTSVAFTYAVAADQRYSVRVGATGAGAATGPQGSAGAVVSVAPAVAETGFDGSTVTASWAAVLDPSVTAYVATLAEVGGAVVGSPVTVEGTSVAIPASGLSSSKSYQVTVQALSGASSGPAGAAGNVVVETVAVATSSYDGALLTLTWNDAQTEGATYLAQVLSGSAAVAAQLITQNSAAIPVVLAAGKSYTAAVRVIAGAAGGPSGAAVSVIAVVPGVSTVTAGASTVTAIVDVPVTTPNVSGYRGWLYEGDRMLVGPVPAITSAGVTSIAFSYAVVPQARYGVRVQAIGSSSSIAGPVSGAAPVISSVPAIVAAGYDGSQVTVEWEASPDPNVSGYLATLSTAEGVAVGSPVATAGTRAAIPATSLSLDTDYVVTVTATSDAATGPASVPANPLADSVGFFFPDEDGTAYPYLFRGDLRAPGASNITLYLPALFSGQLAASIVQDPFTLSATAAGSAFPFVLTVPQDAEIDVWNVNQNGIRPDLQAAYSAFLTKVETDEAGILPGALNVVRQAIAQGLPLTFAETLYYSYGLDPSSGAVDLMAGTRLRIDYEEYQSVPPGTGTPQPLLSGYTGAGTSVYDVGSQPPSAGVVPLGMNAFFSTMPVPTVAGNSGGGGGILDLIASDFQMPYLRLLFPPSMVSADSGGSVGVSGNIVFLTAMSWTQLQVATAKYNATQGFSGVTGIDYTYFRGRAALFPEVPVRVSGSAVYVPIGTTVRQVIERVAALPYGVSQALTGFAMRRPIGAVVSQQDAYAEGYALGRSNEVHFGPQGLSAYRYTSGLDAFDLPVLGGDVFVLADEPAGDG